MRRTGILFLLFLFGIGSIFAQDITFDTFGMHGSGGTSDYSADPGETISVRIQHDTASMLSVSGTHYDNTSATQNQFLVAWYDGDDPSTSSFVNVSFVTVSNWSTEGTGNDKVSTFEFDVPSAPSGGESFQLRLGLYGMNNLFGMTYGTAYTSDVVWAGTNPPGSAPPSGWQGYIDYVADTTALPPVLTDPANGSRDNSSIAVEFELLEPADAGSVKLYIDNNSTFGNSNASTLTLTSAYETAGTHSFSLTGSNLDGNSSIVASRSGLDALTNGSTYYWYIEFDDELNNGPARNATGNAMTYDTAALPVQSLSGAMGTGTGLVDVGYTLQEDASDLWVIFYDNDLSNTRARLQVREAYADTPYLSGAHTLDELDATNFNNSVGTILSSVDGNYSASLVNGQHYLVKVEYVDEAENTTTTTGATTFEYINDQSTKTPTSPSAGEAYNTTDDGPVLAVGYNLPEEGLANSVRILIDDDTTHPSVGVTDASGLHAMLALSNEDASGSHSFNLTTPFTGSDNGGDGDQVGTVYGTAALTNGATYYYAVEYRDAAGNNAARTSWTSFTWDGATASFADFTAPVIDNYYKSGDTIPVTYQLGETGRDGSIEINIYGGSAGGSGDLYTTCYLASGQSLNNTSPHTISLNPANLSSATQVSSASPYTMLPDDSNAPEEYWFEVVYRDTYGNTEIATTNDFSKRHVYYDDTTIAATLTAPVAGGSTATTSIDFNFTIGEAMSAVYIDFIGQGTISRDGDDGLGRSAREDEFPTRDAATHTLSLTGSYLNADTFTPTVDGSNLDALANSTRIAGSATLEAEEEYDIRIRVVDLSGNTQQITTNEGFTYLEDTTTDTPSISAPTLNSYQDGSISFSFNLDEAGSAGTVQILFDDDATHTSVYETLTFSGENASGPHTVTLENMGTNISGNTEVSSSSPNNYLADDSGAPKQYYVAVRYQDADGNPAATSAWHTFYFDNETLPINLDLPAASQTITGAFNLQYDLQETALAGNNGLYVKFVCTSASENDRTFAISSHSPGNDIVISNIDPTNIGGHASLTLFGIGSSSLSDGETYTVSIHTRDLANNTEQSDSNTGVTYSTVSAELTVANIPLDDEPLGGASSTDQRIMHFSLVTNPLQTADVAALSFAYNGTSVTGDFGSNTFELWEDTDNNSTLDSQIWSSTSISNPLAFSGAAITITDSPRYFYVICDLDATIDMTHTIRLTLNQSGVTSPDAAGYNGFPIQGLTHYLDGYIAQVDGGATGVDIHPGQESAVLYWYVATNQGDDTFATVTVQTTTTDWNDIDAVRLYSNTSNSMSGAVLVEEDNSPSGTSTSFTVGDTVDETLTYYLVTVEVNAGATDPTHTFQASVDAYTDMAFNSYGVVSSQQANFPIQGTEETLPVELSAFNITNQSRTVSIAWTTQTETDNLGFNLYRGLSSTALQNGQTIKLNASIIAGAGSSTEPTDYLFNDEHRVEFETTYYYWLETVSASGQTAYFAPVAFTPLNNGGDPGAPGYLAYGLHQNYPNPFNPETTISFTMQNAGMTSVEIYNLRGQLVKKVFEGNVDADKNNRVVWTGRDEMGNPVGSGVYFYRLRQGSFVQTKQMILMR